MPMDLFWLSVCFSFSFTPWLSIFLFTLLFQDWSEHCGGYLMPLALCLCILLFLSPAYLSLYLAVTRLGKPGWHDQSWVAMVTVPLVWQQWWWQYSTRLCVLYFFFSEVWVAKRWWWVAMCVHAPVSVCSCMLCICLGVFVGRYVELRPPADVLWPQCLLPAALPTEYTHTRTLLIKSLVPWWVTQQGRVIHTHRIHLHTHNDIALEALWSSYW